MGGGREEGAKGSVEEAREGATTPFVVGAWGDRSDGPDGGSQGKPAEAAHPNDARGGGGGGPATIPGTLALSERNEGDAIPVATGLAASAAGGGRRAAGAGGGRRKRGMRKAADVEPPGLGAALLGGAALECPAFGAAADGLVAALAAEAPLGRTERASAVDDGSAML
jgi:hypothetical protein